MNADDPMQAAKIDRLEKKASRLRLQVVGLSVLAVVLVLCVPGVARRAIGLLLLLCLISAGYAIAQGLRRFLSSAKS